jgi:hypothetical protein
MWERVRENKNGEKKRDLITSVRERKGT